MAGTRDSLHYQFIYQLSLQITDQSLFYKMSENCEKIYFNYINQDKQQIILFDKLEQKI